MHVSLCTALWCPRYCREHLSSEFLWTGLVNVQIPKVSTALASGVREGLLRLEATQFLSAIDRITGLACAFCCKLGGFSLHDAKITFACVVRRRVCLGVPVTIRHGCLSSKCYVPRRFDGLQRSLSGVES
jgi:hypothetical protein